MEFTAQIVTWQLEEDFWLLGFADSEFETRQYLMLQRAYEFDEQDTELGMDTYYFEINDQGCSGYGGIKQFELQRNTARIELEPQKAVVLGIKPTLKIQFELEQAAWDELRTFLENIFLDTNVLEIKI